MGADEVGHLAEGIEGDVKAVFLGVLGGELSGMVAEGGVIVEEEEFRVGVGRELEIAVDLDDFVLVLEAFVGVCGPQGEDGGETDLDIAFAHHFGEGEDVGGDAVAGFVDSVNPDEHEDPFGRVGEDVVVEAVIQAVDAIAADAAVQN